MPLRHPGTSLEPPLDLLKPPWDPSGKFLRYLKTPLRPPEATQRAVGIYMLLPENSWDILESFWDPLNPFKHLETTLKPIGTPWIPWNFHSDSLLKPLETPWNASEPLRPLITHLRPSGTPLNYPETVLRLPETPLRSSETLLESPKTHWSTPSGTPLRPLRPLVSQDPDCLESWCLCKSMDILLIT